LDFEAIAGPVDAGDATFDAATRPSVDGGAAQDEVAAIPEAYAPMARWHLPVVEVEPERRAGRVDHERMLRVALQVLETEGEERPVAEVAFLAEAVVAGRNAHFGLPAPKGLQHEGQDALAALPLHFLLGFGELRAGGSVEAERRRRDGRRRRGHDRALQRGKLVVGVRADEPKAEHSQPREQPSHGMISRLVGREGHAEYSPRRPATSQLRAQATAA